MAYLPGQLTTGVGRKRKRYPGQLPDYILQRQPQASGGMGVLSDLMGQMQGREQRGLDRFRSAMGLTLSVPERIKESLPSSGFLRGEESRRLADIAKAYGARQASSMTQLGGAMRGAGISPGSRYYKRSKQDLGRQLTEQRLGAQEQASGQYARLGAEFGQRGAELTAPYTAGAHAGAAQMLLGFEEPHMGADQMLGPLMALLRKRKTQGQSTRRRGAYF